MKQGIDIIHKIYYAASMVILAAAFILITYISCMLFYPYNLLEANSQPFEVITKDVRAGEDLVYVTDICKFTDAKAVMTHEFINGIIYSAPSVESNVEAGCYNQEAAVHVPETLLPSTYHMRIIVTYKINPLREITYTYKTEEFNIIK